MVVDWEQETGLLMSSGDVRIVRIWDTEREMKVQVTAAAPLEGLRALRPRTSAPGRPAWGLGGSSACARPGHLEPAETP